MKVLCPRPARRVWLLGLSMALLAACAGDPSPRSAPRSSALPPQDALFQVRAQGAARANEGLEVTPLRDPVISDLLDRATRHEHERRFAEAEKAIAQALALSADDPELLQWQAELALAQGHYDEAVRLANLSWEKGPRLGGLCRRNWAAIQMARELSGYPEAALAAQARIARCTVEAPVRM